VDLRETPILRALIEMSQQLRVPLHVPGHKQGRSLPSQFAAWLGQAPKLDLTELPGLDNLHAPAGCIAESERLAALHYGSEHCFYSVNGSSAGVMAAILAAAENGKVLLASPFHQSAWRGLVLANADAVLLPAAVGEPDGRHRPPTPSALRDALRRHPDVSAVLVTSPTYQGVVADVRGLADVCHEAGVPLLVDEAHGAHFGLIEAFPAHSVACGADVVVQSVHKMLPGLTQTAWVHHQGTLVSAQRLEQWLLALQTTSPSYLLLASLDVAQAWLRTEGPEAAVELLAALESAEIPIGQAPDFDPLRHWIPTGSLAASQRIQLALQKAGVFVEYADGVGVLSVFGFGLTTRDLSRYQAALADALAAEGFDQGSPPVPDLDLYAQLGLQSLAVKPRDAYGKPSRWVALRDAAGKVAGGMITPYPPGVPVVVPGQRLDAEIVAFVERLLAAHSDVHGVRDGKIAVLEGS
jgi:arginine/lysine/ornithine decarboxylase